MDSLLYDSVSTPWMVFGIVLMAVSVVAMFIPRIPTNIIAYMAMWAVRLSGYIPFSDTTMLFWGIAVLLVVVNRYMLPDYIRNSRRGVGYIAGGALVGMMLGLTIHTAATVICGSALFAFIGAVAYSRTSRGSVLEFPTAKFFNYLGAKGIPAAMAASMVGLILTGFIVYSF